MKNSFSLRYVVALLCGFLGAFASVMQAEGAFVVDAHRPVWFRLEVTNFTQQVQTIGMVKTSCACLDVPQAMGRKVSAGQSVALRVQFNPRGLSGHVAKTVTVRLDPSGLETVFPVEAEVRVRCGLSPCEVVFGAGEEDANRIHVDLCGYAVSDDSAVRITEVLPPANPAFAVEVDHDGRGVSVSCPKTFEPNGLLAETWRVRTNDREVQELALPMSACMQSVVDVVPPQIVVDRRDSAYRCVVRIRSRPGVPPPNVVSAVAKPRMWGETTVERSVLGGWRIGISKIDFAAVRQFSRYPYLEVRTDVPGAETIIIPLRVVNRKE